MKPKLYSLLALTILMNITAIAADNWKEKLQKELPLLGHRN